MIMPRLYFSESLVIAIRRLVLYLVIFERPVSVVMPKRKSWKSYARNLIMQTSNMIAQWGKRRDGNGIAWFVRTLSVIRTSSQWSTANGNFPERWSTNKPWLRWSIPAIWHRSICRLLTLSSRCRVRQSRRDTIAEFNAVIAVCGL